MKINVLPNIEGVARFNYVPHYFSFLDTRDHPTVDGGNIEIHGVQFEFKSNYNTNKDKSKKSFPC